MDIYEMFKEEVEPNKFKCAVCGDIVDSGLMSLGNHYYTHNTVTFSLPSERFNK